MPTISVPEDLLPDLQTAPVGIPGGKEDPETPAQAAARTRGQVRRIQRDRAAVSARQLARERETWRARFRQLGGKRASNAVCEWLCRRLETISAEVNAQRRDARDPFLATVNYAHAELLEVVAMLEAAGPCFADTTEQAVEYAMTTGRFPAIETYVRVIDE